MPARWQRLLRWRLRCGDRILEDRTGSILALTNQKIICLLGVSGRSWMSHTPESLSKNSVTPSYSRQRVEILECTLRDGSYAVDFKFTENDTAILAGVLGRLGFRWIEVGHGVGLGAMKAGKGAMPATDERLIEAAKRAAPMNASSKRPSVPHPTR